LKEIKSHPQLYFRVAPEMLERLDVVCADLDANRSQIIRRSLKNFISEHELNKKHQRSVLEYDPEAMALAGLK
jgi:metal-responsive CopG/Arc/MetJ family transcriptional regulator